MTSVAEIVEAVKQLPPEEKRVLLEQLGTFFWELGTASPETPPDFTRRLVEHFHRAKRAALCEDR